jgi:hypothetical protein
LNRWAHEQNGGKERSLFDDPGIGQARGIIYATTLLAGRRERGNQKGMRCRAAMFDCGLTVETKIKGKERKKRTKWV